MRQCEVYVHDIRAGLLIAKKKGAHTYRSNPCSTYDTHLYSSDYRKN